MSLLGAYEERTGSALGAYEDPFASPRRLPKLSRTNIVERLWGRTTGSGAIQVPGLRRSHRTELSCFFCEPNIL